MRTLLIATLSLCIASCGWQLQGYQAYTAKGPNKLASIDLVNTADNRLFQAALIQQLQDLSIAIDKEADIRLTVQRENTEKRPLSYSSTGIPVQYQLIMSVRFNYTKDKSLVPLEKSFIARRQYDFDTELLVAKYEEELSLLQEMRVELANRIIASMHQ